MNPYLSMMRINVCILSVIGLVVGGIVSKSIYLYLPFALAAIVAFLITGAGNVINDYFDYKIDKINKPKKPLPSGRISLKQAKMFYVTITAIGLILSAFVSVWFFGITLLNVVILSVYSWKFKKIAILGNILVAWLAASTFLAAGLIDISLFAGSLWILSGISLVGTIGREVIKDIEDVAGDMKEGARTLPIVAGNKSAKIFASIMLLIACGLLVVPYLLTIFSVYYFAIAVIPVIMCLYAIAQTDAKKSQKAVKLAMLFIMAAFIIGSFV